LHFPEFFPLDKLAWHRLETRPKQQLKRADAVIAVSDSTKQDIERFYGVKSEKIKIIYSGVTNSLNTASGKKRVRDINGNFILFLGTIEPRKNVIGLIKAFEILKKEHKRKEKLVIAGHQGWFYHDVYKAAAQSQYTKEIIFTGSVTPEEKSALCKSASVFVYPSFFEGFGFPSLEAMAHGTPVVTSHTSSLPEVVGNAALMVNPWHPQELAAAINTFLTDRETRSVFIRRGFKNAVRFPWKHCAEETLQTLAASIKV
jgi:glycosyltransferase involved in cell wall biosynthesis